MPETVTAPTPAPVPASEPTQSAKDAAVVSGNTSAYRQAKRFERAGKPLPPVPVKTEPAKAEAAPSKGVIDTLVDAVIEDRTGQPAEPKLSRKDREQQETNDRIRKAVEHATADLRLEVDRLRTGRTDKPLEAPAATAAPVPEKFPSLDQWAAQKDNEGKTLNDYLDARDEWRDTRTQQTAQTRTAEAKEFADLKAKETRFSERMRAGAEADPQLATKIPQPILDAKPLCAFSREELAAGKATFANVISEAGFRSEDPVGLFTHLGAHRDLVERISHLPPGEWLYELALIDGQLRGKAPAPAAVPVVEPTKPKLLTDHPAPREGVTPRATEAVDPKVAAINRQDTRAYRQVRRQERLAAMGR